MRDELYKYYEDERAFQPWGMLHPAFATTPKLQALLKSYDPKRYRLDAEREFWFDGRFKRVCTSDPEVFLQLAASSLMGGYDSRLFVAVHGRRVQFSGRDNAMLVDPVRLPRDPDQGPWIWEIAEIGAPLNFHTLSQDIATGVKRPHEERWQRLTNASRFRTREDLDLALTLVRLTFHSFGNPWGADATFGREKAGTDAVRFTPDLLAWIERGDFVDG